MRSWTRRASTVMIAVLAFWFVGSMLAPSGAQPQDKQPPGEAAAKRLQKDWQDYIANGLQPPLLTITPLPQVMEYAQKSATPFANPPEVRSQNGVLTTTLTVNQSHLKLGRDKVFLRTYNDRLVGPTLRVKPGDTLRITLKNELGPNLEPGQDNTLHAFNTTNLHTHGLHVSPSGHSDNVLVPVDPPDPGNPGKPREYEIKIPATHPAGTFWYHAHNHGSVAAQVGSGMAGALIIEGGQDEVPEIAAAKERILVLQQVPYNKTKGMPEGTIELDDHDALFAPGAWAGLDRFTTVNGLELPVIEIQPGAVERWRLIDTGVREAILLRLMKVENGKLGATIPLHAIANDGISLGAVAEQPNVLMFPGYRADVMVQAPAEAGEYLIVDDSSPATRILNDNPKARSYIGRLIVKGEAKPMKLPASAALAKFRPKSIAANEVTGTQKAVYGLLKQADGTFAFTIDKQSYDHTKPRNLYLNDVDEWTLTSFNNKGTAAVPSGFSVTHPFHIHVNPFEVFSMVDETGVEQVKTPVWKDTLAIPSGWTIKFRTKYTDFTGEFVQHCHILDHEDQGMMQLVRINPPRKPKDPKPKPAGAFNLPDAAGRMHKRDEFRDKPVVLVFSRGFGCVHCSEQIAAFAEKADAFRKLGCEVVFVSTDTVKALEKAQAKKPLPFLILADPDGTAFRTYGCHDKEPLHGTYVIDKAGMILWDTTGESPMLDVDAVLREVDLLATRKR